MRIKSHLILHHLFGPIWTFANPPITFADTSETWDWGSNQSSSFSMCMWHKQDLIQSYCGQWTLFLWEMLLHWLLLSDLLHHCCSCIGQTACYPDQISQFLSVFVPWKCRDFSLLKCSSLDVQSFNMCHCATCCLGLDNMSFQCRVSIGPLRGPSVNLPMRSLRPTLS